MVHLQTVELNILDASGLMEATLRIMEKIRADDSMMDNQIESSIIFARRPGIDPEVDFNRHHRPRRTPRRVDEQAGTAAVLSLQQFYRKQLREVLDILTSRMSEHLANARRVFCRC